MKSKEEIWIRGAKRLPGLFTTVKWRNADGGNIPLPDATPLEHYQRCGANINWHEWLDESEGENEAIAKLQASLLDVTNEAIRWKKRCEASEKFIAFLPMPSSAKYSAEEEQAYYEWQSLKSK